MLRRNSARAYRGMTLIELMMALIFIGIILGMVFVNMESINPRARIESSCRDMASTLIFARDRAIASGRDVIFKINLDDQRYYISTNALDDEGKVIDEMEDTEIATLKRGVRIESVFVGEERKILAGIAEIKINPEGVLPGLVAQFSSQDGPLKYAIRMNPITGLVRIHPKYVEAGFVKNSVIGGS